MYIIITSCLKSKVFDLWSILGCDCREDVELFCAAGQYTETITDLLNTFLEWDEWMQMSFLPLYRAKSQK